MIMKISDAAKTITVTDRKKHLKGKWCFPENGVEELKNFLN